MLHSFILIITAILQDVILDEVVDQSPPPAAEAENETVEQCEPERPDNYAKERTKKVCLL